MATQWFSNMVSDPGPLLVDELVICRSMAAADASFPLLARAQVMDEPSFFHQWQSDTLLEQYTEQQIAVAFGQGEPVDHAVAAALATTMPMQLQQPAAAAQPHHRPRKAAKVNTSWDSCITEQGSPAADSSSPTILSFGGHTAFAKAEPTTHQPPSGCAGYYGAAAAAAKAPKQEMMDAAAMPPFQQARPAKRSYDDMAAVAEAANAPSANTRPASQNQDHILAERKRREKLSQRFIALSKIVPGLKKVRRAKSMATCRRARLLVLASQFRSTN
jgi:hypothetical protein